MSSGMILHDFPLSSASYGSAPCSTSGLQVGAIIPTVDSTPVITTINAGKSKVYGLEANASYQPDQVRGLTINTNIAWTHARFTDLNGVPCYGGQTIAAGCNQDFTPAAAGPGTVVVNGVTGNYFGGYIHS